MDNLKIFLMDEFEDILRVITLYYLTVFRFFIISSSSKNKKTPVNWGFYKFGSSPNARPFKKRSA